MTSRLIILTLLVSFTSSEYTKLRLGGECETLRKELEGSESASVKLEKLNTFLDSLGSDIRQQFWTIVTAAKTDARNNLPSDTAKTLAEKVISDFEQGNLFLPHKQVGEQLKSDFEKLNKEERDAVKKLAKEYGKQIKALIMPVLPASCKPSSDEIDSAAKATQAGGFDTADYMTRRKRELLFIDNLTAAFREYRRRRL